jgi:hypothetical protein
MLELAAEIREATHGQRRSLAAAEPYELFRVSLGAKLDATQDGGGSQPRERHGLAAEVHIIDRRRINPVRRVFHTRSLLLSGDSIIVFEQPRIPRSVPSYRQAA